MNILLVDPQMNLLFAFEVTLITGISDSIVLWINVNSSVIPCFECGCTMWTSFQGFLLVLLQMAFQGKNINCMEIAPPAAFLFIFMAFLKMIQQSVPIFCFEVTYVTSNGLQASWSFSIAFPKDLPIAIIVVLARIGHELEFALFFVQAKSLCADPALEPEICSSWKNCWIWSAGQMVNIANSRKLYSSHLWLLNDQLV